MRFGLIGPSYASQSPSADAQLTRGWYMEAIESGQGKSAYALYPTPGKATAFTLSDSPNRVGGRITINGRSFSVAGSTLFEELTNNTFTALGSVGNDSLQVSLCASSTQLLVISAGRAFVYSLTLGGALTEVTAQLTSVSGTPFLCAYSDGFFLVIAKNSQKIQQSNALDATTWPAAQVAQVSLMPDNLTCLIVDHREVWLQGQSKTLVYYDAGNANFAFLPNPSAYIESGNVSGSAVRADNSLFWMEIDDRGQGIARRANGYGPSRVSNHAVEYAWSTYSTISDCFLWSYQDQGHTFVVFQFPTANATWVYDAAIGDPKMAWHQRSFFSQGVDNADLATNHNFCFGKHLVGDRTSGKVYQMAIPSIDSSGNAQFCDDAGTPIRRVRRAPPITNEDERIFFSRVQIDAEAGVGLQTGQGSNPIIMLRWSDDGGHTFNDEKQLSWTAVGGYRRRAYRDQLGESRHRIFEIACSDPIPWRIIEGYVLGRGMGPQKRLTKKYEEVA